MAKKKKKNAYKRSKSILTQIKKPAFLRFLGFIADTQGCGTIRVIYPYLLLNHIIRKDLRVTATYMANFIPHPEYYKDFTLVQFQRSATDQHYQMFMHFKQKIAPVAKVPIIYEIDDLLINIPEWNYAYEYYKKNEDYVKKIIGLADGVVTSTIPLADVYSEFNKNIVVILNHLPKFIWGDIYPAHEYYQGGKIKILWAGSANHFSIKHLAEKGIHGGDFGDELMNFIRKTTDKYEWIFMGAMPMELENMKNKIKFVPWVDVFNYPRVMKSLEADMGIAPLVPGIFNESKSNIKQLEFVASGMPGVYSDIYPYKNTTLKCKTDEEIIANIEKLADDIDFRAKVFESDYRAVKNQLFWEDNNNLMKYIDSYLSLFGKRL